MHPGLQYLYLASQRLCANELRAHNAATWRQPLFAQCLSFVPRSIFLSRVSLLHGSGEWHAGQRTGERMQTERERERESERRELTVKRREGEGKRREGGGEGGGEGGQEN